MSKKRIITIGIVCLVLIGIVILILNLLPNKTDNKDSYPNKSLNREESTTVLEKKENYEATNKIDNKNLNKEEIIYSNTLYFSMGSCRIKIYSNGDVYDDIEIEEPNHEVNYKKVKTLTNDELKELKFKIDSLDKSNLEEYVKQLIYEGKKNPFDN